MEVSRNHKFINTMAEIRIRIGEEGVLESSQTALAAIFESTKKALPLYAVHVQVIFCMS